jgi:hypothetical protein
VVRCEKDAKEGKASHRRSPRSRGGIGGRGAERPLVNMVGSVRERPEEGKTRRGEGIAQKVAEVTEGELGVEGLKAAGEHGGFCAGNARRREKPRTEVTEVTEEESLGWPAVGRIFPD